MLHQLPLEAIELVRERYVTGVADSEAKFSMHSADEDAITGGLGDSLSMAQPRYFLGPGYRFSFQVTYKKIRGRGPGAPERIYGADGIFQIMVTDFEGRIFSKGLPFQSKVRWKGRNKTLLAQTTLMQEQVGDGIVIDYSETGYKAFLSKDVIEMRANRKQITRAGLETPLGQLLGNEFLQCKVGTIGLYFDSDTETFANDYPLNDSLQVVSTKIKIEPSNAT